MRVRPVVPYCPRCSAQQTIQCRVDPARWHCPCDFLDPQFKCPPQ